MGAQARPDQEVGPPATLSGTVCDAGGSYFSEDLFLNQDHFQKITILEDILTLNNMICDNSSSISPSVRTQLLTLGKISWNLINYAIFEI